MFFWSTECIKKVQISQHLRGLLIFLPDPFHPHQKRTIILTSNNIRLVLSISQNVSKSHNVKTCWPEKKSFKANVNLNLHELESHRDPGKASEMITGLVAILPGHDMGRTRCQTTGLPETPSLNSNRIHTWRPINSVPWIPAWCQQLGPIWLSRAPLPPQSPGEGDILGDDALLAGDRVPHAGSTQRVHALHNDKWGFLQRYDAQVVILLLFRLRTHSGPHVVLHLQGLVFPLPYLHRSKGKTQKPLAETGWPLLASPSQLLNKGQRCWLCP